MQGQPCSVPPPLGSLYLRTCMCKAVCMYDEICSLPPPSAASASITRWWCWSPGSLLPILTSHQSITLIKNSLKVAPNHWTHDWGSSRLANLSVALYLIGGQSICQWAGQHQSVSGPCRGSNLAYKSYSLHACLLGCMALLVLPSQCHICRSRCITYVLVADVTMKYDYRSSATSYVHPAVLPWDGPFLLRLVDLPLQDLRGEETTGLCSEGTPLR